MNQKVSLLLFDAFFVLLSAAFALSLGSFFADFSSGLPAALIFFLLLGVAGSMVAYFSPDKTHSLLVSFLAALAFLVGSFNFFSLDLIFISSFLVFAVYLLFGKLVSNEAASRLNFSAKAFFGEPLKALTTLFLGIVCLQFFFVYTSKVEKEGFTIPESLISPVADILGERTITLLTEQIAQSSKLQTPGAVFTEIPEEVGEAGLTQTLEKEFGVKIDRVPKNSTDLLAMLKPALTQKIRAETNALLVPYLSYIPLIVTLLIFLSLSPFSSLWPLLTTPFIFLVFRLLEAAGVVKEEERNVSIKRPVLS